MPNEVYRATITTVGEEEKQALLSIADNPGETIEELRTQVSTLAGVNQTLVKTCEDLLKVIEFVTQRGAINVTR